MKTAYLVSKQNPTTLALIGLSSRGVPHYSFYGHDAADCSVGEADLPDLPRSVAAMHFGSYSVVVDPTGLPVSLYNDATAACGAETVAGDRIDRSSALYIERSDKWSRCSRLHDGGRRVHAAASTVHAEAASGCPMHLLSVPGADRSPEAVRTIPRSGRRR